MNNQWILYRQGDCHMSQIVAVGPYGKLLAAGNKLAELNGWVELHTCLWGPTDTPKGNKVPLVLSELSLFEPRGGLFQHILSAIRTGDFEEDLEKAEKITRGIWENE